VSSGLALDLTVKIPNPWRHLAAVLCAVALVTPPVDARDRKGDKLLKDGQKAEAAQDYDTALTYFEQALEEDSREPAYLLATQRVRSKASEQHLAAGRKLLDQQKLNEALVQFQKALLVDPSSQLALQLVGQTNEMVKERNKLPEGTVVLTPAERARREVERRINSLEGPPVLRPINNQLSSLKMNNQTSRVIYESVGKLAGINVLFDPAGIDTLGSTTRNFNLELKDVTLEEALNYVALVTHTFWKPISRNAIFVTQESEPKRQEYQDEVVKVFYIQNASTPNEFTEIFNGVRTGAKLTTGIFQVASQNAIIARGTPDTMALVEKLVHDLDRAKAEVLIDVVVLEVSRSKITNLGAALQGQGNNLFTVTPGTSTTSTTSGTSTTSTSGSSISLSRIGKISSNNFSLTLPGAVAQALLTDSRSRVLQSPQVRVTDGGKGSLKIGQKIPYVSGSLNSAVATPGSIPYATTQFQQIDVGVNIDVQPHVNGPNDISMHIKVEISSVVNTTTIAGVAQPIIGQKVNEADVRMRDGEYSLLGGLSMDSDSQSIAGLPGVSALPVLGYLFGTRQKDKEKDDILVALVPHIIRAQVQDDQLSEGVLAGTERMVRVERKPQVAPPVTPMPMQPTPGAQPAPPLPPPGGGTASILPPTNNPKMSVSAADRQIPVMASAPAPATIQPSPQPVQRAISQAPVQQPPPGTEITPLQGMQQMGLAPDPLAATIAAGLDGASDASTISVGGATDSSQVGPELSPQNAPDPATLQVVPDPGPAPDGATSTPASATPTSSNSDGGSYASVGPQAADSTTDKASAATAKAKATNLAKAQLTNGTSAPGVSSTSAPQPGAATPSSPAAKQSGPVQLLEGHLTQEPDSSSSTKPAANPKQE
jgi:general secretion pathway protein D